MELLYGAEHRRCVNYGSYGKPIIEIIQHEGSFRRDITTTFVLYLLQGTMNISYWTINDYTLSEGSFMLFPPGCRITGHTKGKVSVLIMRIKENLTLCDKYTLENLYHLQYIAKIKHIHLKSNAIVKAHIDFLVENITNGLQCVHFIKLKMQEFFYYLCAYYTIEELAGFNQPLLNANAQFMDLIWKNYRQAYSVEQFADMIHCSVSTFRTKFKNITGMPVGKWLLGQKIRDVYYEICCGYKDFEEISTEYYFSSVARLRAFCLKNFGKSPCALRYGKNN